ncbi:MAG: TIGR03086 family protein [Micropruina sp.]|nr:TIGR03086 family protein [Micropruina sp.]
MTNPDSQTFNDSYRDRSDRLGALLAVVPADRWDAPSPCVGWTARDVLDHVVTTQRQFMGQHGLDLGAAPDLVTDPASAWQQHAATVHAALCGGLSEREYDGFFGPTTIGASIDAFYGFDLVVHRWDIARAAGLDTTWSDGEMDFAEAAADGFGEMLHAESVCGPAVPVPADARRQDRLLGRLGRDPHWAATA